MPKEMIHDLLARMYALQIEFDRSISDVVAGNRNDLKNLKRESEYIRRNIEALIAADSTNDLKSPTSF